MISESVIPITYTERRTTDDVVFTEISTIGRVRSPDALALIWRMRKISEEAMRE